MVQMKKRTRADKGKRRSHHALVAKTINKCSQCGKPIAPHTACAFCGTYKKATIKTKANRATRAK